MEFWRQKCQELEKIIKTLSSHCVKVVEKHEELLINYKKNQEQYVNLVQKLKDQGEQIKKAKSVLEPVTLEYQTLRDKYEIARQCQYEAENYASKMNQKNKVLVRQSSLLMNKIGQMNIVDLNFEDEPIDSSENEYYKELDRKIKELSEEKSALSAQVKNLHEDYQLEKERNSQLKERLETCRAELKAAKSTISSQESTLQQLAKTSEAACKEYEDLQKQFEIEYAGRTQVEKMAHNLYVERETACRQSAMLMKDIGDNNKLMEALIEVEDVNKNMGTMKFELEQKIKSLQDELTALKERSGIDGLESEILRLIQERDSLLQRLEEAEKTTGELRSQYSLLTSQYADLEKKFDNVINIPPPRPPPPPPPPPISKTGGFLAKITGGKKRKIQQQLALGGADVNKDYSKAVDEMMKRIKQGNIGLRPVLKTRTAGGDFGDEADYLRKIAVRSCPDEDEDGKAMKELQNILNKMKKARSEEDITAMDEPTLDENSELAKAFKKIQHGRQNKNDKPKPAPRNKLCSIADEHEQ
ncbi:hypothetical protein BsWGS_01279 [Bradybaena similaris]